jgi:aspartate/methionine/tyrosine aminotransferase
MESTQTVAEFQPPARLRGIEKSAIRALFDRALPGSINLGLGEPDLPTPDVVRREAARVVMEEQNGYTTHAGLPALRALVANDYPHMSLTPERVVITAGSQEALYLTLMSLVDAGDEVLLPDPGFVAYPVIVRMAGGVPVFYKLPASRDFSFDAEDFRRKLSPRTKVVVCISPSNPTGRVLSRDELAEMADALRGTNARVVSDEIYREIHYTEERPASISEVYPERTIVVSGLSKSMSMTGWRLGWMCGEESVVRTALVLHGYVTTCASAVSQKSALMAWTDEAARAREVIRQTFQERRDFLLEQIASQLGLRAVAPDGAFYTMLDTSAYGTSSEVADRLLAARVITVPGGAFGAESEGYLRVSFCADKTALEEGVRRIAEALKSEGESRIRQD